MTEALLAKVPPENIEAEQATLGSMMLELTALGIGIEILHAEDFYRPVHQDIFAVLEYQAANNEPADLITLQEALRKRGKLDDVGGTEYLMVLVETVPTAANIEYYAKTVWAKSMLRKLISFSTRIIGMAYEQDADCNEIIAQATELLIRINSHSGNGLKSISEITHEVADLFAKYQDEDAVTMGLPFGHKALDELTQGNHPEEFNIIAGWPSEGKTSLATQMAIATAKTGAEVLIFSNEMSNKSLTKRMACQIARVSGEQALKNELSFDEWSRLYDGLGILHSMPITLQDMSLPLTRMVMTARNWALEHKDSQKLIIVDYIQIVECDIRVPDMRQQVIQITKMLKRLAKDIKTPVVALSQLSRRKDEHERPELGHLKESGSIEADADKVIMIHNPRFQQTEQRLCELYVRKYREGRPGMVHACYPEWLTFEETDLRYADYEPKRINSRRGGYSSDWVGEQYG